MWYRVVGSLRTFSFLQVLLAAEIKRDRAHRQEASEQEVRISIHRSVSRGMRLPYDVVLEELLLLRCNVPFSPAVTFGDDLKARSSVGEYVDRVRKASFFLRNRAIT